MVLEKKILKFVHVFLLPHYYHPWKKDMAFIWKKLEFTSSEDALCQVWLYMAQWFWRQRYSNFVNVFQLICYNLPFEKDMALHLKKNWVPTTKGCFVPSLDEIGPAVHEKKMKMWKVYRNWQMDSWVTNNRQSEKLTWAFSIDELKKNKTLSLNEHFLASEYGSGTTIRYLLRKTIVFTR